jgi:hypothetical protein
LRRLILAVTLLGVQSYSVEALTVDRAFETSVDGGVIWTSDFVDLENKASAASTITLRQHIFREGGYFVGVTLGHGNRSRTRINPLRSERISVLTVTAAFGVFGRLRGRNASLDYRLGYEIAGDGQYFTHFVLNGITVTRRVRGNTFLRLDAKWLASTRRGDALMTGLGYGISF